MKPKLAFLLGLCLGALVLSACDGVLVPPNTPPPPGTLQVGFNGCGTNGPKIGVVVNSSVQVWVVINQGGKNTVLGKATTGGTTIPVNGSFVDQLTGGKVQIQNGPLTFKLVPAEGDSLPTMAQIESATGGQEITISC